MFVVEYLRGRYHAFVQVEANDMAAALAAFGFQFPQYRPVAIRAV